MCFFHPLLYATAIAGMHDSIGQIRVGCSPGGVTDKVHWGGQLSRTLTDGLLFNPSSPSVAAANHRRARKAQVSLRVTGLVPLRRGFGSAFGQPHFRGKMKKAKMAVRGGTLWFSSFLS